MPVKEVKIVLGGTPIALPSGLRSNIRWRWYARLGGRRLACLGIVGGRDARPPKYSALEIPPASGGGRQKCLPYRFSCPTGINIIFWLLLAHVTSSLAVLAEEPTAPRPAREGSEKSETGDKAPTPSGARAGESPLSNAISAGEEASRVQTANLIYAGVHSSVCFSDHFLTLAETESSISTSRRFHSVKASSPDLFKHPLVIMTGEGAFQLLEEERINLKKYCEKGGLLLASAGCSSADWDRSFRVEMSRIFPDKPLRSIPMEHKIFNTVYEIKEIKIRHGSPKGIEGIELNGLLAVVYSSDGLNDTGHVHGCCCCGGNEIANCEQINVNILAYALTH